VLVSGVHHSGSVFLQIALHYMLLQINGYNSLCYTAYPRLTHFVSNGINEIRNSSDVAKCDMKLLQRYHFELIARDGIFFLPGKLGAISYAHSDSDIKKMIDASARFSAKL